MNCDNDIPRQLEPLIIKLLATTGNRIFDSTPDGWQTNTVFASLQVLPAREKSIVVPGLKNVTNFGQSEHRSHHQIFYIQPRNGV